MKLDERKLTCDEAKKMVEDEVNIKGYTCFFVNDFKYAGYFKKYGYSVLVFKNGKHIYSADDYEIYHKYLINEKGKKSLKELYIKNLNNILFTDEELMEDVRTYDEYCRKHYFLRNIWIMRYDYVSSINTVGEEDIKKMLEVKKTHPFFNPICSCFISDKSIVDKAVKYARHLEKEYKKLQADIKEFRIMISCEMLRHKVSITGRADEVLESLRINAEKLTDEQKKVVKEELEKRINSIES